MREREENQPRDERRALRFAKRSARRLEQLAVRNAGRACRFTGPATKAPVDMGVNGFVVRLDRPFEQRAHEKNPTAGTLVFVLEREISRTCLKTESAVDTLIDSRQRSRQRGVGERAGGDSICRRRTLFIEDWKTAHETGPMMPGLRMRCGSNACMIPRDNRSDTTVGESTCHISTGSFS